MISKMKASCALFSLSCFLIQTTLPSFAFSSTGGVANAANEGVSSSDPLAARYERVMGRLKQLTAPKDQTLEEITRATAQEVRKLTDESIQIIRELLAQSKSSGDVEYVQAAALSEELARIFIDLNEAYENVQGFQEGFMGKVFTFALSIPRDIKLFFTHFVTLRVIKDVRRTQTAKAMLKSNRSAIESITQMSAAQFGALSRDEYLKPFLDLVSQQGSAEPIRNRNINAVVRVGYIIMALVAGTGHFPYLSFPKTYWAPEFWSWWVYTPAVLSLLVTNLATTGASVGNEFKGLLKRMSELGCSVQLVSPRDEAGQYGSRWTDEDSSWRFRR